MKISRLMNKILCASVLIFCAASVHAELVTIYYHNDHLGNPVAATNEQGEYMWKEDYSSYGDRQIKQDGGLNSVWYTGKEIDPDTGLVYFGARWYDPSVGQFLSLDPAGVRSGDRYSFNRYAYGNNSPYRFIDPDGRQSTSRAAWFEQDGTVDPTAAGTQAAKSVADGAAATAKIVDAVVTPEPIDPVLAAVPPLLAAKKVKKAGEALEEATAVTKGIKTPYGIANQATDAASMAARGQVENGSILYRIGKTGKSQAAEAQFWSLENPLSAGYAQRYGLPASNVKNSNFIETATVKPGTLFVTRPAPGVGSNTGGGIEVVVPQGGVQMRSFNYGEL